MSLDPVVLLIVIVGYKKKRRLLFSLCNVNIVLAARACSRLARGRMLILIVNVNMLKRVCNVATGTHHGHDG